jgi:hypothetical protein
MTEPMKYPPNPLTAFENGCMMDLRLRLAVEFVKASLASPIDCEVESEFVKQHLDLAEQLFDQAEERGWVQPMPDDNGHLSAGLRDHIERNVNAQVHQQTSMQRQAERAVRPAGSIYNG